MVQVLARMAAVLLLSVAACSSRPESATQGNTPTAAQTKLTPTDFDGEKAFAHVRKMVEMGPRPVGSEAHDRARDYLIAELKSYGMSVKRDDFTAETPLGQRAMTNVIGELPGRSDNIIILGSHYDTKLFTKITFVGANDGGSSTGALLEIARVLAVSHEKPLHTLWFVFFDGEEAFVNWTNTDSKYGSRHLAEKLSREGTLGKVKALILLDMIGDKDLDLKRDAYSTSWLVDVIWNTARELGYGDYFGGSEIWVDDDHVPFLQRGVPAVDLIDFNYGLFNRYWHTEADTLDKLSPKSLKIVGDTVIRALPRIEATIGDASRSKR